MRYSFLAFLDHAPGHGYELKQAFEQSFGAIWPELNFGQVYTTLARLERDGLVQGQEVAQEHRRDKKVYELTPEGEKALHAWIEEPQEGPWVKDEFFMKLAMAQLTGVANPIDLIQRQRILYLQALHDLTSAPRKAGSPALVESRPSNGEDPPVERPGTDIIASLIVEGAALHLEADLKWLDVCERAFGALDRERSQPQ